MFKPKNHKKKHKIKRINNAFVRKRNNCVFFVFFYRIRQNSLRLYEKLMVQPFVM